MIAPEDFVLQWTYSDLTRYEPTALIRYEPAAVLSLAIPEFAQRFLIEAGLPSDDRIDVPAVVLPTLMEQYGDTYAFPPEIHHFRVLRVHVLYSGTIFAFDCLDDQRDGNVMLVYQKRGEEFVAEFLNSSVVQYAEALLLLRRYHLAVVRTDWASQGQGEFDDDLHVRNSDVQRFGQATLQKLRLLDPPSFQVDTGWEEQMYYLDGGIT